MQVMHRNDGIEALARKGPISRFQIDDAGVDAGYRGKARDRGVAIDRDDARSARGEEPCVPPAARREVQHARTARDQGCEANDPARRRVARGLVTGSLVHRAFPALRPRASGAASMAAASSRASSCNQSTKACASGRAVACSARTMK